MQCTTQLANMNYKCGKSSVNYLKRFFAIYLAEAIFLHFVILNFYASNRRKVGKILFTHYIVYFPCVLPWNKSLLYTFFCHALNGCFPFNIHTHIQCYCNLDYVNKSKNTSFCFFRKWIMILLDICIASSFQMDGCYFSYKLYTHFPYIGKLCQ